MDEKKKNPKKTSEIYYIEWQDIISHSEWMDFEEAKKEGLADVQSIGFLLNKDKNIVRLAATLSKPDCSDRITIPTGVIRKKISFKISDIPKINSLKELFHLNKNLISCVNEEEKNKIMEGIKKKVEEIGK